MPVACLRVGHKVIDLPDCLEPEAPVQKACVLSLCFGLLNTRHAGIGRIEADGKKYCICTNVVSHTFVDEYETQIIAGGIFLVHVAERRGQVEATEE